MTTSIKLAVVLVVAAFACFLPWSSLDKLQDGDVARYVAYDVFYLLHPRTTEYVDWIAPCSMCDVVSPDGNGDMACGYYVFTTPPTSVKPKLDPPIKRESPHDRRRADNART